MKFFFLLLFSLAAFAQEEECLPPGLPSESALLKAVMAPLQLWVVTDAQMAKAPCKTKLPPSIPEMDQVISNNRRGAFETKVINGVTLSGSSKMLKMFEDLTTRWLWANYKDKNNQKNFQNLFNINPACANVTCAMEKIWGTNLSKKMSYLYLHFGFNSSEYSFENSDRFTEAEIDDILVGLGDFPRSLTPLSSGNRQLTRYIRGKWNPEFKPETFGDSSIQVYDPWTRTTKMERQQTIFHEVAHTFAEKDDVDRSQAWLNLSGWQLRGDKWRATKPSCMVSRYGDKNPEEDFAETAVAFRYNPSRLYKACPAKYKFMKKIFDGHEYFAAESCTEP